MDLYCLIPSFSSYCNDPPNMSTSTASPHDDETKMWPTQNYDQNNLTMVLCCMKSGSFTIISRSLEEFRRNNSMKRVPSKQTNKTPKFKHHMCSAAFSKCSYCQWAKGPNQPYKMGLYVPQGVANRFSKNQINHPVKGTRISVVKQEHISK